MEKVKKISISFPDIGNKPVDLYYLGYFEDVTRDNCVAVVGSRRMTEYGRQVIKKLVPGLVQAGKTVVSGLMYGVDQTTHKECIACGGRTIAVLGWGLTWDGAGKEEKELMREIVVKGGAVISEWENAASNLWMFPHRDRLMAAMSSEIYVIEGAMKSGSLITAEWGRKLGKQVWAVPGPVTSRVSEGTNWLISTGKAQMWLPGQQLRFEIETKYRKKQNNYTDVYNLLQNEALSVDEIALKLGRSVENLGAELTMMEIKGEIEERTGKYYIVE
jgi:DNA processing protein